MKRAAIGGGAAITLAAAIALTVSHKQATPPLAVVSEVPVPVTAAERAPAVADVEPAAVPAVAAPPVVVRRRAVVPKGCDDNDRATAARYGMTPGYECLLTSCTNRDGVTMSGCMVMHGWLSEGGEVTEWMASKGFDSPLANCSRPYSLKSMEGMNAACLSYEYDGEQFFRCAAMNPNASICDLCSQDIVITDFPCVYSIVPTYAVQKALR